MNASAIPENMKFLMYLQDLIDKRKTDMPEGSYTAKLFTEGLSKIAQKVGEEAVELIIESREDNDEHLLNEAADLIYHLMVLLSARQLRIEDVIEVLKQRHYGK
jgi:phosphoribosyl-ATP pyrophosphohydrolase/phosphoribosyl-AMP cyclohydrolase